MKNLNNVIAKVGLSAFITLSATVGAPYTAYKEGLRLKPYMDGGGVKTWCRGETEVNYKEEFTEQECDVMFYIRYGMYSKSVALMYNDTAKAVVTPRMHAALVDMAYNIGINGVRKSSMMRLFNAGQPAKACEAFLLYKYAAGQDCSDPKNRTCPGVWTRRKETHKMCLEDLR